MTRDGHYTTRDVQDFARAFHRSNVRSIDDFLSRNYHFSDVGKTLIAAIIRSREDAEKLYSEDITDHWYRLLWNEMIEGVKEAEDLPKNAVKFVTFNYDRSLEAFLHISTKNTFALAGDQQAYRAWSKLEIVHVYGSVGSYSFENPGQWPQYGAVGPREIREAAAAINIIPEGRNDAPEFDAAREWLKQAEMLYVLGFGFDAMNCARLGFDRVLALKRDRGNGLPPAAIVASAMGLTQSERGHAERNLMRGQSMWSVYDNNNTMTLRHAGLPD